MSEVLLLGRFSAAMAQELDANSHKWQWWHLTPQQLLVRLRQELGELERAIDRAETPARVLSEAADLANFAAMIADVYGAWGDE